MIENIKFIIITKTLNLSRALPNKVVPQLVIILSVLCIIFMEEKNAINRRYIYIRILLSAVSQFVLRIHKLSKTVFLFASHITRSIREQPKLSLYYYITRFVTLNKENIMLIIINIIIKIKFTWMWWKLIVHVINK